ncbi:hypothetical protein vBAbaPP1_138 [Acinetobacter phage vB_AbaM_P1]|nr:hypothetical protein vBAbaPP1_138 [Acinetobacter phage vB_AbaM_P1]WAX22619.1 hypothetical protein [Acinetobacter phage vB_AbaP_HB01]
MFPCFGGPLDGMCSRSGKEVAWRDGNRVVSYPYSLRTYAWDDGCRVNKISVLQHKDIDDQDVIDCMNAQLNLNPVEKKS